MQPSAWQIPVSKLPPSPMKSATNPRLHSAEHSKNLSAARRANGGQCLPEQQYPRMSSFGVICRHSVSLSGCLLYPRKRTFNEAMITSALGQLLTRAPQRWDYLITSSARARSVGGTVRPSILGPLGSTASSNRKNNSGCGRRHSRIAGFQSGYAGLGLKPESRDEPALCPVCPCQKME